MPRKPNKADTLFARLRHESASTLHLLLALRIVHDYSLAFFIERSHRLVSFEGSKVAPRAIAVLLFIPGGGLLLRLFFSFFLGFLLALLEVHVFFGSRFRRSHLILTIRRLARVRFASLQWLISPYRTR